MTREERAKKGLHCHRTRNCAMCPYAEEDDPFLDPMIDPNYDANIMIKSKRCRDNLLDDLWVVV